MRFSGYITRPITQEAIDKLNEGRVIGSGGRQDLMHRLQKGVSLQDMTITVGIEDLARIVDLFKNTGYRRSSNGHLRENPPGRGGYQKRVPINSFRNDLPSIGPLFGELMEMPQTRPWVYFVQETFNRKRIKIGQTGDRRRRGGGRRTDNAEVLDLLCWVQAPEHWNEKKADAYFHQKFEEHRCPGDQEWFWPADDILEFCRKTREAKEDQ